MQFKTPGRCKSKGRSQQPRSTAALLMLLAALAALAALSRASSPQARKPPSYRCSRGLSFEVEFHSFNRVALVHTPTRTYALRKAPTRIGVRYTSAKATLIIDENFAAFVAEDRTDFSDCNAARRRAGR